MGVLSGCLGRDGDYFVGYQAIKPQRDSAVFLYRWSEKGLNREWISCSLL